MKLVSKLSAPMFTVEPHINTGYRPQMSTTSACLRSMFAWHNQTINIWTSVMLVAFNLWLAYYFAPPLQTGGDDSNWPFVVFFWAQGGLRAYCWFNSWAYHTFSCQSRSAANYYCKVDYVGCHFTALAMGSNLLFIEFHRHPCYQIFFLVAGLGAVGMAIALSLTPQYQSEKYRKIRMMVSVFSSVPYLVGIVVAVDIAHDGAVPAYYSYLLYAAAIELFAGFFYASAFPEIVFPEYFDLLLPSHSIWHWLNFGFDALMMWLSYSAMRAAHKGAALP